MPAARPVRLLGPGKKPQLRRHSPASNCSPGLCPGVASRERTVNIVFNRGVMQADPRPEARAAIIRD
jgi:hypothetical protein